MPSLISDAVETETNGFVRVVRLNRVARKNALSDELGWAIVNEVKSAAHDDAVRVVVITGNGDAFCSGADLSGGGEAGANNPLSASDALVDDHHWISRLPLTLRVECDKPVLAGVNGIAIGAGLSLALCADIRIAARGARFHPGYARAATSPDGGLSVTLPWAVGYERALRFLLECRMLSADEALGIGLVSEVVDDDALEARLMSYATQLAELAPLAARQTKRLLMRSQRGAELEAQLRDELRYVHRGLSSEDGKEAVAAIMEKRAPVYRGQ